MAFRTISLPVILSCGQCSDCRCNTCQHDDAREARRFSDSRAVESANAPPEWCPLRIRVTIGKM